MPTYANNSRCPLESRSEHPMSHAPICKLRLLGIIRHRPLPPHDTGPTTTMDGHINPEALQTSADVPRDGFHTAINANQSFNKWSTWPCIYMVSRRSTSTSLGLSASSPSDTTNGTRGRTRYGQPLPPFGFTLHEMEHDRQEKAWCRNEISVGAGASSWSRRKESSNNGQKSTVEMNDCKRTW